MSLNIEVQGGTSVRLLTKGKYCDRDIVVTATAIPGGGSLDDLTPTPSLVYTLSSDGSYYIVGTGFTSIEAIEADTSGSIEGSGLDSTWTGGKLVIPAEYNGKPVKAIAPKAFAAIYNITQVYIYDGLTHIGHRCFQCPNNIFDTAMVSCRLPNTLTYLGGDGGRVFWGRQGITHIAIPEHIEILQNSMFANCNALTAVNVHNVKTLASSCFQYCHALATLNADNITTIGDTSFYSCHSLKELSLPNVETIGNNVFYGTSSLTKVTIGANCKSVSTSGLKCGSAVNKCTLRFEGKTPPIIQSNTFEASYINKIVVPQGCGNAYKTATNWGSLASYIEETTQ